MPAVVTYSTAGSWTDAFAAANFNGLANTAGVISTATAVTNAGGNMLVDLSFICVTSTFLPTAAAGAGLDFYLLPQLHDGTLYAEGATAGAASTSLPTATYFVGRMVLQLTTAVHQGMVRGIVIPNGTFKWFCINNTGPTLPASATNMTCQYRTYSYNLGVT